MSGIIYDLTGSYHVAFYTMAILAVLTIVMTVTAEKPKIR